MITFARTRLSRPKKLHIVNHQTRIETLPVSTIDGPGKASIAEVQNLLSSMVEASKQSREPVDINQAYPPALFPGLKEAINLALYLPFLFRLKERAFYTLQDYGPFVEFWDRDVPPRRGLFTGRQCSKSTTLAADMVMMAMLNADYEHLYVVPLYEQTRRFSSNYVKPFIDNCLLRRLFFDPSSCEHNVLQKSFLNGSKLHFGYCFTSADRNRGLSVASITFDECQDVQYDFMPIITEAMTANPTWRTQVLAGTAKTLDNTLERHRMDSSRAEWLIPCEACHKDNIACLSQDMEKMLGPSGLICAKCGRPIDTRLGRWLHELPDRRPSFPGWHIPQPILPMHCEDPRRWKELKNKEAGKNGYRQTTFRNEVLGEACDVGAKLITIDAIRKASILPFRNRIDEALDYCKRQNYLGVAIGIDWGGRGVDMDSFTAFTVIGLYMDSKADVLLAVKAPPALTDTEEVDYALMLMRQFGAQIIGHDYRGVGQAKDTMLLQKGLGRNIQPWANESTTMKAFIHPKKSPNNRHYISINRGAACQLLAHLVNTVKVRLPQWEEPTSDRTNPFMDLNSWFEDYVARPDGTNLYHVLRSTSQPDDVGWSIIYGLYSLFRRKRTWPMYTSQITEQGILEAEEDHSAGDGDS
jgi:hypothetical protein